MKDRLDWKQPSVANIYDELSLWSAPFGDLLLQNIPMKKGMSIVDLGFGTGFPLIELSQRFGNDSKVYGVDIWTEGINRTKEKIKVLDIENITLLEKSATQINIEDNRIDLVTSNLGINNFNEKEQVYTEIFRILKLGGRLSITTNPIGTFKELFVLMEEVINELKLEEAQQRFVQYISHRNTQQEIVQEIEAHQFKLVKKIEDTTSMRFVSAKGLMNHGLMRIGFRAGWDTIINPYQRTEFYQKLMLKIDQAIMKNGEFQLSIPLLYLEFEKY